MGLEIEEIDSDFSHAIKTISNDISVIPIPAPHVTVLYGMTHLNEKEIRYLFCNNIRREIKSWPALRNKGFIVDTCYDGIDGQEMDMTWKELSHFSSDEHEELVDKVHAIMYDNNDDDGTNDCNNCIIERPKPWLPHTSLAYDNP